MDWVQRAKDLSPAIDAASERIDAARRIAPDIMSAMHEAELFRMCLPRSMGGGEAPLPIVLLTVEAIASAEASTAWCLGQGLGWCQSYSRPATTQDSRSDCFTAGAGRSAAFQ